MGSGSSQSESAVGSGKTWAEAFIEIVKNPKLLFLSLALVLLLLSFATVSCYFIVTNAEPGSTIKIFNIEFIKSKTIPAQKSEATVPTDGYALPKGVVIKAGNNEVTKILDGSLAIQGRLSYPIKFYGVNDSSAQQPLFVGGSLVGPNVRNILIGGRSIDGQVTKIYRTQSDEPEVEFNSGTYLELLYRRNYFSITCEQIQDGMKVSVQSIKSPTLELVSPLNLNIPSAGGE